MVSRRDERFAAMAAEEALKSPNYWRIGCVAVMNGKVIEKGHNHNRVRFRNWQDKPTFTCHAEADVIHKLIKRFPTQLKVVR